MFKIIASDAQSRARAGVLHTAHGDLFTPAYAIVGTRGSVLTLSQEDIAKSRAEVLMVNTYHMWKKLGESGLENYEGLHTAMHWQKPIMTDSGGFQVFSLGEARAQGAGKVGTQTRPGGESLVTVNEESVTFSDGGKTYFLAPEDSIRIQDKLGSDIIFPLDEPSSPLHDVERTREAMERTHRWAQRSLAAKKSTQLLYGIVQGGPFENLRNESARAIGAMPFDGFAIGGSFGESFGSTRESTIRELEWTIPMLPQDKPRHLLGIGRPQDIFMAVAAGIDTFDCVIPTREGRHGSVWTRKGRIDLTKGSFRQDECIVSEQCGCMVCSVLHLERRKLHELIKSRNPDGGRFATLHNVYFFSQLMDEIRTSIAQGRFARLCAQYGVFIG